MARRSAREYLAEAKAAYERAVESGHREQAPNGAMNLGGLLGEAGDTAAARAS